MTIFYLQEDAEISYNLNKFRQSMNKKNGSSNLDISPSKESAPTPLQVGHYLMTRES